MEAQEILAIVEKFLATIKALIEAIFGGSLSDVVNSVFKK